MRYQNETVYLFKSTVNAQDVSSQQKWFTQVALDWKSCVWGKRSPKKNTTSCAEECSRWSSNMTSPTAPMRSQLTSFLPSGHRQIERQSLKQDIQRVVFATSSNDSKLLGVVVASSIRQIYTLIRLHTYFQFVVYGRQTYVFVVYWAVKAYNLI